MIVAIAVAAALALAAVLLLLVLRRVKRSTERHHAELSAAEAKYRTLIESLPIASYIDRLDQNVSSLFVSPQFEAMLGYPPEAWYETPDMFAKLLHPEDRDRVLAEHDAWYERGGGIYESEYRLLHADGTVRWFRDLGSIELGSDGAPLHARGFLMDTTEAREADRERRTADERYRRLAEELPLVTYVDAADEHPTSLYISPQIEQLIGYTPAEWLADRELFRRLLHPDDLDRVLADIRENNAGRANASEYRVIARDGRTVWFEDHSIPERDEHGIVVSVRGYMIDVTERKLAEERLREAEQRYRVLVENLPLVTYVERFEDGEWRCVYMSPQVERVTGYPPERWLGSWDLWVECLHPDDRERVRDVDWQNPPDYVHSEYRLVRADGRVVRIRDEAVTVRDATGKAISSQGYMLDVTAEREASEALVAAEESYRSLVERLPLVTYADRFVDGSWHCEYVSPQIEALTGYSADEWLGDWSLWEQTLHPEDRDRVLDRASAWQSPGVSSDDEYRLVGRDGGVVWVRDSCLTFAAPDGRGLILQGYWLDVTPEKQAAEALRQSEEQLRQAQKMEAIGRLAGGVAHDFNNLLTVISGNAALATLDAPHDDAPDAPLAEIRRAADRAADLTRQLLAFSRRQMLQPTVLDLNEVLVEMQSMLRRLIGEDVELTLELAAAAEPVRADRGQVEQVIMNLAVNARDAMPRGGTLTITTACPTDNPGFVELTVRDSGSGMDESTMARIFEPFFTTKGPSEGTGLGLATVHGIVEQSGGHVTVESAPGHGTTFRVLLPAAADHGARESRSVDARPVGGVETILLVEDDPSVRRLAGKALARAGYSVIAAESPAEALGLAADGAHFDLLLTDVVMPGTSGSVLAGELLTTRPTLRVLYMSGYTDDAVLRHGISEATAEFLPKPFTPQRLAERVREVLDGPSRAA